MASERVNPADLTVLYAEDANVHMNVGGVLTLTPPRGGLDYQRLIEVIGQRLGRLPRYRQRLVDVPANLSGPRWVDDEQFDVTFHVRRSALPAPGDKTQLAELVSRLMSRRLDRDRPLWEVYLVEGLAGGQIALITKTHSVLVDGVDGLEIGEVLLERDRTPAQSDAEPWRPARSPGPIGLLLDVTKEAILRPTSVLESATAAFTNARRTTKRVIEGLQDIAATARWMLSPATTSPFNVRVSAQRRFAMASCGLKDLRLIKKRHGGTINDAVLATVAGALRAWLLGRGEVVREGTTLRALVPLTVTPLDAGPDFGPAGRIESVLIDLPIGMPDPAQRLAVIRATTAEHHETERAVDAAALTGLSQFAPQTLHALGARVGRGLTSRAYNLIVANVPGPQHPLYAAGARLREVYPVVPLSRTQGLAIGATSYDGTVYIGINGDRDAMADVTTLAALIDESLAELVAASR